MSFSADEQAALVEARARSYYVRSGRTIHALRSWVTWCRANGRPVIVVAKGTRQATIELDGVKVWTGPESEAEDQAAAIAREAIQNSSVDCI